jgi:broad specificity phosphatase PhoE
MTARRGEVIVLRGLPGIGKTTVSAMLRDRLAPSVRVSVDTIRYLARPRDLTAETVHLGELAAAAIAETYAADGFLAIIEGVFLDTTALAGLVGRLRSTGTHVTVVTLTGALDEAVARNAGREPETRLPQDRITWLHAQFDQAVGITVDTGEYVAEEVTEIVEERLAMRTLPEDTDRQDITKVLFLRHGAAALEPDRYPDHMVMGLSPQGREQILGIRSPVRRLKPEAIVCSPMPRARESAEILAHDLGIGLEVDERLRERTFPELYGQSTDAIAERIGLDAARQLGTNSDDVDLPGAESLDAASARVQDAIVDLSARPERRVLVVAHGGPHGWLCAAAVGAAGPRFGRRVDLGVGRMSTFALEPSGSLLLTAMNCSPWGLLGSV